VPAQALRPQVPELLQPQERVLEQPARMQPVPQRLQRVREMLRLAHPP
jgi:hypothetical protein